MIKNYYDDPSISYSSLCKLSVSPAYFKKIQEDEDDKEHFIIGSLVDILLTEPNKLWEIYALEFQKTCENIPTGQIKDFIDLTASGVVNEEAYILVGFKRDKLESVLEKVKNFQEYFNYIKEKLEYNEFVKNKKILTNSQYSKALDIVNSLKSNKFTKLFFENKEDFERYYQLEIYYELYGVKCKSKLDLVEIDHKNKIIYPIDFKTTGNSVFSFNLSSLKYRYDIQACMYSMGLYWLINKSKDEYWNRFKDYKIELFKFIVESSKNPGFPLVYKCTEKFLEKGLLGFVKDGKKYPGVEQLIKDYKWYKENNSWDYSREIIENEGILTLDYSE